MWALEDVEELVCLPGAVMSDGVGSVVGVVVGSVVGVVVGTVVGAVLGGAVDLSVVVFLIVLCSALLRCGGVLQEESLMTIGELLVDT